MKLLARLFNQLMQAMFEMLCIALVFIGAATWMSMKIMTKIVKFIIKHAYEILVVLVLLRLVIFVLVLLTILFGLKRR